jgi:hypothetical protein
MVALVASIAVGVACGWVITLWWKISVHAAIAAGSRRLQKDRVDDHRDDQRASDRESDGKASSLTQG